ncbi:hypothetical protein CA54_38020 [Symmachiella macrocystis]|uniref:Uncharacterized protein n=1 Tax=Symmachiella macrocystis TaxID=2527985 RepID=A0A5C6BT20_9PLAN|nr:hypothetical protein [Symmachiella macrocystis]TWU14932.1 hypothetical protein CA54_38020 [Symmachiella macrocystis]
MTLETIRFTLLSWPLSVFCVGMIGSAILADEPRNSSHKMPPIRLSARHVGEYAAVPWSEPGAPIAPGSREDRVRDLNLGVSSVNLTDDMSDAFLSSWATRARWAREQDKAFLPRIYFWDGTDRFKGPLRDIEVYWKRLDTFLAAMNLQDFAGIVLAEENIHYAGRPEVLRELYRRVKEKYDVAVWQWWSPMSSVPSSGGWIPADGWVIDLYFLSQPTFRRMVRKYLIAGVPLVVMPWAAQMDLNKEMTEGEWAVNTAQLDTAVEFNLPVAFFWIYGTSANFGGNRGEPQTEMDRINHWVWDHIERVHKLPYDFMGFDSADLGTGDLLEIGPTVGDRLVFGDGFANEKCIDTASMTGFRNFVMDGETLAVRGFRGRDINSTLEYRFQGDLLAQQPTVSLDVIAKPELNGKVELALSADGNNWITATSEFKDGVQQLKLASSAESEFAHLRDFRVRVRITGKSSPDESPSVRIDNLRIEAGLTAPEEKLVRLKPTDNAGSHLEYDEQFLSQKYRWLANLTNESHIEWSNGQIGVRMRPGGSAGILVWKVTNADPLRNIRVQVEGHANPIHLGTNHYVDISTDGEHWSHEVNTTGKPGDVNGWVKEHLTIDASGDPEFQGVREFYVRIRMNAQSYSKEHPNLSSVIRRLLISAETTEE